MAKFYSVSTVIYDDGRSSCCMGQSVEAEKRPENKLTSTGRADYYIDWFDTLEEAQEFIKNQK